MRSKMIPRKFHSLVCLVFLAVLITACQAAAPSQPPTLPPAPSESQLGITIHPSWTPTRIPSLTPFPSSTPTLIPSRTPTITTSPTPRTVPVYAPQTTLSVDLLLDPNNDALHDLILFTSSSLSPFNLSTVENDAVDTGLRLWAVSPDGLSSGRLTYDDVPFSAFYPTQVDQPPIFIEYGVYFNHPQLRSIPLPDECYAWLPENEAALLQGWGVEACSDFRFSEDGRYLAFFFGPNVCGRGMMLLDTQSGELLFRAPAGRTLGFEFLTNGKIIRQDSNCETGSILLLDPLTRMETRLGSAGTIYWNPQHTAFVVAAAPYLGASGAVWGYNTTTAVTFLPEPDVWQLDNHPLWAPDGQHLLYQHRPLEISDQLDYSFTAPRQIILVDSQTGAQRVLAGDPGYDFHLCASATNECDQWYGDWVQLRRYPFQPQVVLFDDEFLKNSSVSCLFYGRSCPFQEEQFALSWRTGELLPWDEHPLPASTPLPTAQPTLTPGPDLSVPPLYSDPAGNFAFYVGLDGKSLWLVPEDGAAQMWVRDGQGFRYLP